MDIRFYVVERLRNSNLYKVRERKHINWLTVLLYLAAQQTDVSIGEDICSIPQVTATTDLRPLFSPNFPNNYPNNVDCTTTVTSPENTVIELVFYSFQLEKSTGCAKDYLTIKSEIGDNLLYPSCGERIIWPHYPDKIVSRNNDMTIKFTTDNNISHHGFNATFRTVQPSPHLVVIAGKSSIRVPYRYNNKNLAYTLNDNSDLLAVDYDPRTQFIFYSDRGTKTIDKFHVERRSIQVVLHSRDISEPLGLRIDVNSRLLYWTDAELGTVSVSELDGGYRNTLVETELDNPGAIVTEPYRGYIYYTDWGTKPKIERADGDGTNRLILVNTLIIEPRSLAIDLKERALYWIDSAQKSLERVNCDGTGRTLLKLIAEQNVFSLVLDDEAFFWSGYSSSNESIGYMYFIDRELATDRYAVRWLTKYDNRGISLRPYQESGVIIPDTCPTATCRGLCLPKPYGSYSCLKDDDTPPAFQNCPDTISEWAPPGKIYSFVSWNEILLKDDKDFIVSSSHMSGSEFVLGSEVVSIAAKDLAGNEAWCNFSVTVNGCSETKPISPTVYLVICIGCALIVLVVMAVTLQVVFMRKFGQRHGSQNRNQGVDNESVSHNHPGDVLVSEGSVQYTRTEDESYYIRILPDC